MTEEIINVTAPKLSGADRRVALHAIAASAKGNPVEVALQILAGIATLDGGFKSPFVMLWPMEIYDYPRVDKRAQWYAAELARLQVEEGHWEAARGRRATDRMTSGPDPETSNSEEGFLQRSPLKPLQIPAHPRHPTEAPSALGEGCQSTDPPSACEQL